MKNLICKFTAICLCLLVIFSFAGCGMRIQDTSSVSNEEVSLLEIDKETYENNMEGLVSYLKDCSVVTGTPTDMSAEMIGAVSGKKFAFSFNNSSISLEIYEYDLNSLSDQANSVISSVKETGKFSLLGYEVDAKLEGKYLYVYIDSSDDEKNTERKETAEEAIKKFVSAFAEDNSSESSEESSNVSA